MAVGLSGPESSALVFGVGNWFQVVGVTAGAEVTTAFVGVVDFETLGYGSGGEGVGDSVGECLESFPVDPEDDFAVSLGGFSGLPGPAGVGFAFFDAGPEVVGLLGGEWWDEACWRPASDVADIIAGFH